MLVAELVKNPRDLGLIPGLRWSPREGKGYPLQYSGLENSMDCIVHGVTKSRTWLLLLLLLLSRVSCVRLCVTPCDFHTSHAYRWASQVVLVVKNLPANAGDVRDKGSMIPGSRRCPRWGHGSPLQYSCLENPMERSLVGYSPWSPKELDTTEQLHFKLLYKQVQGPTSSPIS